MLGFFKFKANDIIANVVTPVIKGNPVPLKSIPINMAIVILINVDVDPIIDDARPAIWPTGSIANAIRFPTDIAIVNKSTHDHIINTGRYKKFGINSK